MSRNSERSICCGAGGARMWMDENIGKRINLERTDEALSVNPGTIAAACPWCITMLDDGLKQRRQEGVIGDDVQVTDLAELLLASVRPAPTALLDHPTTEEKDES